MAAGIGGSKEGKRNILGEEIVDLRCKAVDVMEALVLSSQYRGEEGYEGPSLILDFI